MSLREPENVTELWQRIFRYEFGTIGIGGSVLTFILIVIWIFMDPNNGLGSRPSTSTTGSGEYFNWHPFLMSLAFLIFMTPAVLAFEVFPFARHTNKSIHGLLNLLAFLAAIAGFAIILDCHNDFKNPSGSFHTVHGCIGLVIMILFSINYFIGFILYGLQWGEALRGTLKPLHKRLGFCVIVFGFVNITLGLMELEIKKSYTGTIHQLTNAIGVICIFTMLGLIFSVAKFVDKKDAENIQYTPIVDTTKQTPNYGAGDEQL